MSLIGLESISSLWMLALRHIIGREWVTPPRLLWFRSVSCFHHLKFHSWHLGSRSTQISIDHSMDSTKNKNAIDQPCPGSRRDACYGMQQGWSRVWPQSPSMEHRDRQSLFSRFITSDFFFSPWSTVLVWNWNIFAKTGVSGFVPKATVFVGGAFGRRSDHGGSDLISGFTASTGDWKMIEVSGSET